MASPLEAGSKPLPEVPVDGWTAILQESIEEVFSMMVGTPVALAAKQDLPPGKQIAGVIGIGGAFTAVLSLRCSAACAGKIAGQMLGVADEGDIKQCTDAIGEICNMVAGNFKAKAGHEADCMLSLPSVISGTNYSVYSSHSSEIQMCFLFERQPILVFVDIRR